MLNESFRQRFVSLELLNLGFINSVLLFSMTKCIALERIDFLITVDSQYLGIKKP